MAGPDRLPQGATVDVAPEDPEHPHARHCIAAYFAELAQRDGRFDPALAADQARTMTAILGRRLVAVECGNEPDQWAGKALRPAGFDYAAYHADWVACADAVGEPLRSAAPRASPARAAPRVDPPRLVWATEHM